MSKSTLFLFLLALLGTVARAQAPDTDSLWIEAGNLRICLRADGSLYSGAPGGAVQYRHVLPDGQEKWVKVVQDAGMWFGGITNSGALALAAQQFEPRATDFRAGIAGVPGSGKIWGVTRDQVEQHAVDYSDNAIIDQPIEAIFAWPGQGNRFFKQYNGFALPDTFQLSAGFEDRNGNGLYEPDKGDYPQCLDKSGNFEVLPSQLYCFTFYSDGVGAPNTSNIIQPIQALGDLFLLDCSASAIFENGFFMSLKWQNTGMEVLDSCMVGLYLNPDIGNPNDDYHGSRWDSYFAYNGAAVDSGGFEEQASLLMVSAIRFPTDDQGYISEAHFIPIGPSNSNLPAAMIAPTDPAQFYNYLTGRWRDGSPITVGGMGYDPTSINVTMRAFDGNPYTPGNWTEVNSNNPPGDRRGLLSWNYQRFNPQEINRVSFMAVVYPNTTEPLQEWFQSIVVEKNLVQEAFYHGHSPYSSACGEYPEFPFPRLLLRTFPNPVSDILYIQVEGGWPTHIRLYDAYKRVVEEIQFPADNWWNNPLLLPVRHLPSGVYYLEAGSRNSNGTAVQKVIILH